jgi:hypothetical protein
MTAKPSSTSRSHPRRRPRRGDADRPSRGGDGCGTEPTGRPEDRHAWSGGAFASPVGWPCAIDAGVDAATDAEEPPEVGTVEPAGGRAGGSD